MYHPTNIKSMHLNLGESSYAELVDFLYDYASDNRLNVLWFGWYQVGDAQYWYERSGEGSNFKIKLELLTEEFGSIFVTSHHTEGLAGFSVDYGDKYQKENWLKIFEDFEVALNEKGWRLEDIKDTK